MNFDLINACLLLGGSLAVFLTVLDIWKKRLVVGTPWTSVTFYTIWACWNVFWYYHLEQWWTLGISTIFMTLNMIWLYSVIRFSAKKQNL